MGFTGSYLISLFLYVTIVNEVRLPTVTCQDEDGTPCVSKGTFLELLSLPEARARVLEHARRLTGQELKSENKIDVPGALFGELSDERPVICLPSDLYLELLEEPAVRERLGDIDRSQRLLDYAMDRSFEEPEDLDYGDRLTEADKRSLATLAKNDDLPFRTRSENEDDEAKRSIAASLLNGEARRGASEVLRDYLLPNGEIDLEALARDYPPFSKRNLASVARERGLPYYGKRNLASVARDYGLPVSGKRNVGSLARDRMLPFTGKRNVGSLARDRMLPLTGKRNVATLARDYALPTVGNPKRYLGSVARSGGLPREYDDGKRSIASLARNSELPGNSKRSAALAPPGGLIFRTLSRHGRSLVDDQPSGERRVANQVTVNEPGTKNASRAVGQTGTRTKRHVDYADEYQLATEQSEDPLDYEELIEALIGQYPRPEKRFMGRIPQMGPRPTTPPTRQLGQ